MRAIALRRAARGDDPEAEVVQLARRCPMAAGLSESVTVRNTVPASGSRAPAAAWALANAAGKSAATPITSPVERISGPSSASAPAKRSNGSTASLTETWSPPGPPGSPSVGEPLAEHHAAGELGQRQAGRLGDERHRPRGARVGLDHVQVVAVDAVLDVDQPDHAERRARVARRLGGSPPASRRRASAAAARRPSRRSGCRPPRRAA